MGENKIKKLTLGISIFFLSALLVSSQSLVEVARKERARRAALRAQGKTSILVTNADLKRGYKRPKVATKPETKTTQRSARQTPTRTQRPATQRPTTQRPTRESTSREKPRQQEDQLRDQSSEAYMNRKYATKVLFSSGLVKNPENALKKPDGQRAELSILGVIDLEISAQNGPGDDIAVYAKLAGGKEVKSGGEEEGVSTDATDFQYWEGFWYGVLVMNEEGEWIALGRGTGSGRSEKFELGAITSTKKIRIMFRPHTNPDFPERLRRIHPREFTFGIDAVEILH